MLSERKQPFEDFLVICGNGFCDYWAVPQRLVHTSFEEFINEPSSISDETPVQPGSQG